MNPLQYQLNEPSYPLPIYPYEQKEAVSKPMQRVISQASFGFDMRAIDSLRQVGQTLTTLDKAYIAKIESAKTQYLKKIAEDYSKLAQQLQSTEKAEASIISSLSPDVLVGIFQKIAFVQNPIADRLNDPQLSIRDKMKGTSAIFENEYFLGGLKNAYQMYPDNPTKGYLDIRQDLETSFYDKKSTFLEQYQRLLEKGINHEKALFDTKFSMSKSSADRIAQKHKGGFFDILAARMKATNALAQVRQKIDRYLKIQPEIALRVQIAGTSKDGKLPEDITDGMVENHANIAFNELMKKEERLITKLQEKPQPKTAKGKKKKSKAKQKPVAQHALDEVEVQPIQPSAAAEFAEPIHFNEKDRSLEIAKRPNYFKIDPRVKFWLTATKEAIVQLQDKEGNFRYVDYSDQQIAEQKLYHSLPDLGQLFSEVKDRTIYSFPTKTGFGVPMILKKDEELKPGVLYYGFDRKPKKKHRLYHLQFIEKSFSNFNGLFKTDEMIILKDIVQNQIVHAQENKESEDQEKYELNGDLAYQELDHQVLAVSIPRRPELSMWLLPVRSDPK